MPSRRTLPAAALALAVSAGALAQERPPGSAPEQRREVAAAGSRSPAAGEAVRIVVSVPENGAAEPSAKRRPTISLSVRDADLVEVLRSLAKIAGYNLVIDPSVRGTVTAELTEVAWDRALAVIVKTNGLGVELDGRVVTVAPPSRLYFAPR